MWILWFRRSWIAIIQLNDLIVIDAPTLNIAHQSQLASWDMAPRMPELLWQWRMTPRRSDVFCCRIISCLSYGGDVS